MRYLCVIVLAGAWLAPAAAQGPTLQSARQRLLHGNYAEARQEYAELAKDPKHTSAATVGLSRGWRSVGEYDKALDVLDAALKNQPKDADLLAHRADLLYTRGRWDDAIKAADSALAAGRDNFLAHWVLARVYRDRGELDRSGKELLWFVRTYAKRNEEGNDVTDPDELMVLGQAALERARGDRRLSDQFQFVLTEVFNDVAKRDKDYWWASYYAGRLFLEKFNHARASKAFGKALTINARAAEVLAARGVAALHRFEMKDAQNFADQALEINPRLVEALCLQADLHLAAGNLAEALKELDKARDVNPLAEPALARVAACLFLQRKGAELAHLLQEVEQRNPRAGLFYLELAERLDERRRYDDAEKYFQQALKLQPNLYGARNSLGLLYMRMGREEEARPILEEGFEADEFNVRVFNTLQVLDHLKDYTTLKTPHFHIRYDPKNDRVLARFVAKYLEDIYTELAEAFQYQPKGPVLIELFNKHEMFSGRVVALPDLHTIGACTGRMVALVSPRDKSGIVAKPFNWNRVLRHELVHIFNLDQTGFQVPHWFTEGLAVSAEKFPRPPTWNHLLLERVPKGELMNLDNIHLGFIRPASAEEWNLAYLQSLLYVEYLKKTHGPKAVGAMLNAYKDGLDTAAAIEKVCQVSKEAFEKGYRDHLQEVVKTVAGKASEKKLSFQQLKDANAKDPGDADVAAQLAEKYLALGNKQEARKLADAALAQKKAQPLASYVKARLLLAGGETDAAVALLEAAVDPKAPEVKVLKLLGKQQFEAKKFAEAAATYELGRTAEPYENGWLTQLAKVYLQKGDNDKLIDTLKSLAPTDADDLDTRRQLAKLLLKAGRHAEAERYAWQALEIDVLDAEAQETLEAALRAQNKDDELRQVGKLLGRQ